MTALLAGTTSVYHLQAPDNATLPYVVFNQQGGGPLNVNPSDLREPLYFVRGYASTANTAGSIDAQVNNLLHKQTLSVVGYTNVSTQREEEFETVEITPSGEKIYMAGAFYRVTLDS